MFIHNICFTLALKSPIWWVSILSIQSSSSSSSPSPKWSNKMAGLNDSNFDYGSGITDPLFNGLTYNMCRYFAHCSYFSSPLQGSEKYYTTHKISGILHVKPSNKVYVFHLCLLFFEIQKILRKQSPWKIIKFYYWCCLKLSARLMRTFWTSFKMSKLSVNRMI